MVKYLIGIDEVGRGPLAGPVTVGIFLVPKKFSFEKIKDSKQLSEEKREEYFKEFYKKRRNGKLDFVTVSLSADQIDKKGISKCIKVAISRGLIRLRVKPEECQIKLDGLLKAPIRFKNQKTIIKGDQKESVIAAASIVAKVTRDRKMKRLSKVFPRYDFEQNKGYGSKKHRDAIKKYGLSKEHRKSYCGNIRPC